MGEGGKKNRKYFTVPLTRVSRHLIKVISREKESNIFIEHHKSHLTSYRLFMQIKKADYI